MNKFFLTVIAASCAVIALSYQTNEDDDLSEGMDENGIGDY